MYSTEAQSTHVDRYLCRLQVVCSVVGCFVTENTMNDFFLVLTL